jgi:hypothetical protein
VECSGGRRGGFYRSGEGAERPEERRGQREPAGPKDEWAARSAGPKARKKNFRIKNWIFELTKALEICRRRFRWNFDMRIFPKFF